MNETVSDRTRWEQGLSDELQFWRWRLGIRDEGLAVRLDPELVLAEDFIALLPDPPAAIRLLDVGAGPLTNVAKRWPGHELVITAVDALAPCYDELLEEFGIIPPVRTLFCENEHLQDMFGESNFDIVHACNTLDHSYDPMRAIRQMVAVTRQGGIVVLHHFPEEAERQDHHGLHRWNFSLRGDDAELWGPDDSYHLRHEMAPLTTMASLATVEGRQMIRVVVTKDKT